MKLYDEIIEKLQQLVTDRDSKEFEVRDSTWPVAEREMILRSDMAYELGGGSLPAVGATIVTADENLIGEDGITLVGSDLREIDEDTPFARIAVVRVDENTIGEGNALYNAIRSLEYTRYHLFPKGFMMRVSSSRNRESVRVSREAVTDGISFAETGNMMISAFHKNPNVKAVHIYYFTKKDFDYKALKSMAEESEEITRAIDHIFKNLIMDCRACNLQEICDEVEGLRELHFKQKFKEQ